MKESLSNVLSTLCGGWRLPCLFLFAIVACEPRQQEAKGPATTATVAMNHRKEPHAEPLRQGPLPTLPQAVISRLEAASFNQEFCSDLATEPDLFESCHIDFLANGTAARIQVVSDCGEHACDVENHLFTKGRQPFISQTYGPSTWEVTPDHRYVLRGNFTYPQSDATEEILLPALPIGVITTRTDLDTGEVTPFAPCISPQLSPQGIWIVCRTFDGSVARLPATGGALTLVVSSNTEPTDPIKIGGPFNDYPGPVSFVSESKMTYDLYLKSEKTVHLELKWNE